MLFVGIPFDGHITLDDAVYYLVNQICGVELIVAIVVFFLTDKNKIASRLILAGVIGWNFKEVYDEIMYICKQNVEVFEVIWGGIIFLVSTLIFAAYGYSKWKR